MCNVGHARAQCHKRHPLLLSCGWAWRERLGSESYFLCEAPLTAVESGKVPARRGSVGLFSAAASYPRGRVLGGWEASPTAWLQGFLLPLGLGASAVFVVWTPLLFFLSKLWPHDRDSSQQGADAAAPRQGLCWARCCHNTVKRRKSRLTKRLFKPSWEWKVCIFSNVNGE